MSTRARCYKNARTKVLKVFRFCLLLSRYISGPDQWRALMEAQGSAASLRFFDDSGML